MAINYSEIEPKWQKAWAEAKVYEADPDNRKGMLVTAAFPYVNTPQHIGHLRTYGTTDFNARYKRHRGYNVLFPMGVHATGTPILAFAKRIANNDTELIENLKKFEIPESDIRKMADINFIVEYMTEITYNAFMQAGLSIDWRRRLISIEPIFSKMVEWQFARLNDAGLLKQGSHPVGWCPNEGNAVGQHDTKGDLSPEIEELAAVCFKDSESDTYFACATYRPETLYGVTNLFVGEKIDYVTARIGERRYFISKSAAAKLGHQMKVEVEGPMGSDALLKKQAVNPINNEKVTVLPGFFVDAEMGTGVVMSVPAHAPFDLAALESLRKAGYPVPSAYPTVLKVENPAERAPTKEEVERAMAGDKNVPAGAYLEMLKSQSSPSMEMLEHATKLVYREESRWGVMTVGSYAGKSEQEARSSIKADLIKSGAAFRIYELVNEAPVICRCGTRVVVKMVEGQWFINYGDKEWKERTRKHLESMKLYPGDSLHVFEKVLDWIDMRAAERAQGLGTKFPFNREHIIESLSDSTIYMTLYTYVNILRSSKISPDQLKPEFFDFVLGGRGTAQSAASSTGIDEMVIKRCRESFEYWYPESSRHSGSDLIYNHLTMYLFNHVALFDRKFWPGEIVSNALVNYEGQKMSKSLGNIIPLKIGIRQHGVDPLRFVVVVGAEVGTDSDFRAESIKSIQSKNDFLEKLVAMLPQLRSTELTHSDFWLYSKLNSKIKRATELLDNMMLKEAYIEIYYNSVNELKKYLERGGANGMVLREFLEKLTIMISPIMPHVAEELWHQLGRNTFAVKEQWPTFDESMISEEAEAIEDLIDGTMSDIRQSIELSSKIPANAGKKPREVVVIVADDWKTDAYNALAKERSISKVMETPSLKDVDKERLSRFLSQFAKRMSSLVPVKPLKGEAVVKGFNESGKLLSEKLGANVSAVPESESKSGRAGRASPGKPAIDIAWG